MECAREKIARAAILTLPGIGSRRLRYLLALFGSAIQAFDAAEERFPSGNRPSWMNVFQQSRKKLNLDELEQALSDQEILLVMPGEENYPPLLLECSDAPPLLFYKGMIDSGREGLAVVGSRRPTAYGRSAASCLAGQLAGKGYVIVSGLARGIDSAAHKGALEAGGLTWAFLAGGLDRIYPPENRKLAAEIIENGALISEYPPGRPCEPGQFPARNRLISGSARGVLVVEAAQKSGSLITVDFALEQGREVFAVPGPIFSEMSRGTHQLIRQGAKLVENVEDVLAEIKMENETLYSMKKEYEQSAQGQNIEKQKNGNTLFDHLDMKTENLQLLDYLSDVPLHIDTLALNCSMSPHTIALGLLELELQEIVKQLPGQYYVLARR
ncbi:DNA protecting protein DprA [Syntrophobotulus glycolicus DSM 8271]|uniref:DNA protecting protein DprA n=1 Tax=Syntrophobotulus glycolicus (strain DSM 8271 / FlGlyR) TaxID=645991 RepID=F0SUB5_SYNGF|nr:DNA-processing protein DprA [Syntrophobotulus glycolicus]ADY56565.1 DNA protecting protein DprA [Syntrophobotulus glycolicus DSM 8271]